MSSAEFAVWQDFDRLSPIGDERLDWNVAMICYTLALINGAKETKLKDFVLKFGPQPTKQSKRKRQQELSAVIRDAAAHGADDRDDETSGPDEARKKFVADKKKRGRSR